MGFDELAQLARDISDDLKQLHLANYPFESPALGDATGKATQLAEILHSLTAYSAKHSANKIVETIMRKQQREQGA